MTRKTSCYRTRAHSLTKKTTGHLELELATIGGLHKLGGVIVDSPNRPIPDFFRRTRRRLVGLGVRRELAYGLLVSRWTPNPTSRRNPKVLYKL